MMNRVYSRAKRGKYRISLSSYHVPFLVYLSLSLSPLIRQSYIDEISPSMDTPNYPSLLQVHLRHKDQIKHPGSREAIQ